MASPTIISVAHQPSANTTFQHGFCSALCSAPCCSFVMKIQSTTFSIYGFLPCNILPYLLQAEIATSILYKWKMVPRFIKRPLSWEDINNNYLHFNTVWTWSELKTSFQTQEMRWSLCRWGNLSSYILTVSVAQRNSWIDLKWFCDLRKMEMGPLHKRLRYSPISQSLLICSCLFLKVHIWCIR